MVYFKKLEEREGFFYNIAVVFLAASASTGRAGPRLARRL